MMAIYNIDETIKNLLDAYILHARNILKEEYLKVQNGSQEDMQNYLAHANAYEFLRSIKDDPKHYLYKKTNIHLTYADDSKDSVYKKLSAICGPRFDNGTNMLVKLSQAISSHVNYVGETNKTWLYDDKGLYDSDAKEILELNKQMKLMNSNNISRLFKDFLKPQRFAIKEK